MEGSFLVLSEMQCGDFYEAIGIDAVLLVQFAGLNPMGGRKPPQAGCPKQNIRRVVADLVENAALSVVGPYCTQCMDPRCSDMTLDHVSSRQQPWRRSMKASVCWPPDRGCCASHARIRFQVLRQHAARRTTSLRSCVIHQAPLAAASGSCLSRSAGNSP